MWQAFHTLGRPITSNFDPVGAFLHRVARSPDLDVHERHDGVSLLAAALQDRHGQMPHDVVAAPWAVPGEPWRDLPQAAIVDAIVAHLVWRGADVFEGWSQTSLSLRTDPASDPAGASPFLLMLQQNRAGLVDQALRHPDCPPMAQLVAARTQDGSPWLHELLPQCPATAVVLVRHGYDPNLIDGGGLTPLMHAVTAEQVQLLLEKGADASALTPLGEPIEQHWSRQSLPEKQAMMKLIKASTPRKVPSAGPLFDHAYQGRAKGISTAPEVLALRQAQPGISEPLSLRAMAWLGLILGQPTNTSRRHTQIDAAQVFVQEAWLPHERLFGLAYLALRDVAVPTSFMDAARREREHAAFHWRQSVRESLGMPTPRDIWDGAHQVLPQVLDHLMLTRQKELAEQLIEHWVTRVPFRWELPLLEATASPDAPPAWPKLLVRNQWLANLDQSSSAMSWPVYWRYVTSVVSKHGNFLPLSANNSAFKNRLTQMTAQIWASEAPERKQLSQAIATLAPDHPIAQLTRALEREHQLGQSSTSSASPRRNRPRA